MKKKINTALKCCKSRLSYHSVYKNDSRVDTAKKMKFSIKDFVSKCDQIRSFLRMWSNLLKKSLMENFFFCTVQNMKNMSSNFLFCPDTNFKNCLRLCGKPHDLKFKLHFKSYLPFERTKKLRIFKGIIHLVRAQHFPKN